MTVHDGVFSPRSQKPNSATVSWPPQSDFDLFTIGISRSLHHFLTLLAKILGVISLAQMLDYKCTKLDSAKLSLLNRHKNYRLVSAIEYCSLLFSRYKLERCVESQLELVGLRDQDTGDVYFVESEKLGVFRYYLRSSQTS